MSGWSRYRDRLSQIGVAGLALGLVERLRNSVLYRVLGFDRWHVGATYHLRPYKSQVVSIVNDRRPAVVVEIGTGLGDIVSRVRARRAIGFDIDAAAIRAAGWIHRGPVEFLAVDLLREPHRIADCALERIDVLVMINWLHGLPMEHITRVIDELRRHVRIDYLLMDLIKTGPGFQHLHTVAGCEALGQVEQLVKGNDGVRDFVLLRLNA